jgi:hypothetical protein
MREELESEKNVTIQRWARREKQLEVGRTQLLGIGGEIQGLAQQSLTLLELQNEAATGDERAMASDAADAAAITARVLAIASVAAVRRSHRRCIRSGPDADRSIVAERPDGTQESGDVELTIARQQALLTTESELDGTPVAVVDFGANQVA